MKMKIKMKMANEIAVASGRNCGRGGGKETESMTFLATVEISLPLEMWV